MTITMEQNNPLLHVGPQGVKYNPPAPMPWRLEIASTLMAGIVGPATLDYEGASVFALGLADALIAEHLKTSKVDTERPDYDVF